MTAALPYNSDKPGFEHLAISVNSTVNVMTADYAEQQVCGNGIVTVVSGHQPAAQFPIVRRPYFRLEIDAAVMTYEGDTGPAGLDGGVFLSSGRGLSAIPVQKSNSIEKTQNIVAEPALRHDWPSASIPYDMLVVDTQTLRSLACNLVEEQTIDGIPVKAYVAGRLVSTQTPESAVYAYSAFNEKPRFYDATKVGGLYCFFKPGTYLEKRIVQSYERVKIGN